MGMFAVNMHCETSFIVPQLVKAINIQYTCFLTVSAQEKEEFKCVRNLYSSTSCINKGIYETFCIRNPYGWYIVFYSPLQHTSIKWES